MTQEQVEDIRWYIIHAYSGQEDRVKKNLDQRIQTMDVSDKIFQVVVPTEEEMEYKIFPIYNQTVTVNEEYIAIPIVYFMQSYLVGDLNIFDSQFKITLSASSGKFNFSEGQAHQ